MNGPLKFLTARKILPCSICSQNLKECSLARVRGVARKVAKQLFFISGRARKKIAVLGMLANARKDHWSPLLVI